MKGIRALLLLTVAATLIGTGTAPASADTENVYLTDTQYTLATATGACVGYVMSISGASDVTMFLQNYQSGGVCTGWLERSSNGSTWGPLSYPASVPSVTGSYSWTKTLNFPVHGGFVRVCLTLGAAVNCSPAFGPAVGGGYAAQEAYPIMYTTGLTSQASSVGACGAALSATSPTKTFAALANAVMYNLSAGVACTTWLAESFDGGSTWRTVSATHVLPSITGGEAIGFTSLHPDGPGVLARACVQLASSGAPQCTAPW